MSQFSQPNQANRLSQTIKSQTRSRQVTPRPPLILRDPTMSRSPIKFAFASRQRQRAGLTLIELLVAVSILVIIAAILVPQLRFATADRQIREASRVVASLFAQASQRAINDGEAGVVIERNQNIVEGTSFYAGTSLFLMRKVPRYVGEEGDEAEVKHQINASLFDRNGNIYIPIPAEQEELNTVMVGDSITFDGKENIQYVILEVEIEEDEFDNDTPKLRLRLRQPTDFLEDPGGIFFNSPSTQVNGGREKILGPFTVYRRPRKLVSSRVDLPSGYLIDLRLSGEAGTFSGRQTTLFNLDTRSNAAVGVNDAPNSVGYLFNRRGAIDRVFYTIQQGANFNATTKIPDEPAYLMVREYRPEENSEVTDELLGRERFMWVTVDPDNGSANVVSGVATDITGGLITALAESRSLSREGQQAAQ